MATKLSSEDCFAIQQVVKGVRAFQMQKFCLPRVLQRYVCFVEEA